MFPRQGKVYPISVPPAVTLEKNKREDVENGPSCLRKVPHYFRKSAEICINFRKILVLCVHAHELPNPMGWILHLRSSADFLLNILFNVPLPPLLYRTGVQGVMAVGVEPQTMPEGRLPREVLFGHALQVVDEPVVRFIQLPQDIGEFHGSILLGHLGLKASMPPYLV